MTQQEIKVIRMIIVEELEKRGLNNFSTTAGQPVTATAFTVITQDDRDKFLSQLSESDILKI